MTGQLHEWVTEQERDLLRSFRAFQAWAPADQNFCALILSQEEEDVLSAFRRYKIMLRKVGVFRWRTQPRIKTSVKSVLTDESKPLLVV